jgi:hypothetical protein
MRKAMIRPEQVNMRWGCPKQRFVFSYNFLEEEVPGEKVGASSAHENLTQEKNGVLTAKQGTQGV